MAFVTKAAFAVLLLSALCLGRTIIDLTHTLAEGGPEIPMNPVMFPNFTHFKQETFASGYPGEWNEGWDKGIWYECLLSHTGQVTIVNTLRNFLTNAD